MSAPARTVAGVLGRVAIASCVAVSMTVVSLLLVRGLTRGAAPAQERPAEGKPVLAVPLTPPPEPADPEPVPPTESARAAAAEPASASAPPPAPAAPSLAGLAPSAAPGSLSLGPIGALPSVDGLPSGVTEDAQTEDDTPTTVARATSRPAPEYPALAQRRGLEGRVTLRLRINARGRVVDAVVVDSEPKGIFDAAARRAARRYRFTPARAGTKPVASTLQQTIRFELER